MFKKCSLCQSTDFRLSKFRLTDSVFLVLLLYPVRCNQCLSRSYMFLPLALAWKRKKLENA